MSVPAEPLTENQLRWMAAQQWGHRGQFPDAPEPPPGGPEPGQPQLVPPGPPPGPPPAAAVRVADCRHVTWGFCEPAGPGEPTGPAAAPAYKPPKHKLTTLGWLNHIKDPHAPYFEWHYLQVIYNFLTERWWLLQGVPTTRP